MFCFFINFFKLQNIEKKVLDLEEKLISYEKKISECKEVDCQKNSLLDELAARSAMILSQVKAYSTINEKINKDLQAERKNKKDILDAMKEKIEHYKNDTVKAITRSNAYKAKTETAEKKLNELSINLQKVEEKSKRFQLNIEQKNDEIEKLQNDLVKTQEKNKNVSYKMIFTYKFFFSYSRHFGPLPLLQSSSMCFYDLTTFLHSALINLKSSLTQSFHCCLGLSFSWLSLSFHFMTVRISWLSAFHICLVN